MPDPSPPQRAPSQPRPGLVLAERYELVRLIASGGMAEVWEGIDRVLERPIAVKILHAHLAADKSFTDRFRSEALAAARLRHPSIVAIYDTCRSDGLFAIVMELVRGRNLREYLDERGRLDPIEVVHIGADVADALTVAHRAGVIHRDIKPANILLCDDGRVMVTDFGIAKVHDSTDMTNTGTMLGTVKYLAPEQIEGEKVDGRTDLYGLGVVLFEALCGRPPFVADGAAATALVRLHQDPPRPRSIRPDVPPALEQALLIALARSRETRFATANAMRQALTDPRVLTPARPMDDDRTTLSDATTLADRTTIAGAPPATSSSPTPRGSPVPPGSPALPARPTAPNPLAPGPAAPEPAAPEPAAPRPTRPAAPSPAAPGPTAAGRSSDPGDDDDVPRGATPWPRARGDAGPPASDAPPRTDPTPRARRSWLVPIVLLVVVIGSIALAVSLLARTQAGGGDLGQPGSSDTSAGAAAVTLAGSAVIDPAGDGEHDDEVGYATDGDPKTTWRTETYHERDFGGLKPGVGLVLTTDSKVTFDQLKVMSETRGWSAQVYVADKPGTAIEDWGKPVTSASDIAGDVQFDLGGAKGSAVLVWITELGAQPMRVVINEVTATR